MPKPLFGENGSGMHTHQSLFRGETNAFFDADDEYFLSRHGEGVHRRPAQARARDVGPVRPSVNSYKRLVPGFEAPVYIAWSRRNRSALVRVPVYHPGKEQATRAELRCPDPSCNPYLTFAAMLHAGLEGIEKGYELPPPIEPQPLRPLRGGARRRWASTTCPRRSARPIEEMAHSEVVEKALGEHIFTRYVDLKREEWLDYRVQVTPWELQQYLAVT